jgi:hypothetical protein
MSERVTERTQLGPLRALPTARHARVEHGNRLSPMQYAQLTPTPDVVSDPGLGSGRASCVELMRSADHRGRLA